MGNYMGREPAMLDRGRLGWQAGEGEEGKGRCGRARYAV